MPVLDPLASTTMESLILDPAEVDSSRVELDLNADILRIDHDGIDWGEAAIQAYMAEGERGSSPVDFRLPNREVTIPLHAKAFDADPDAFNVARVELQAKVALIQREGGSLKRTLANGAVYYLDIVNATLKMGGSTFAALERFDLDIELVLECIPDFYGDEIDAGPPTNLVTNPSFEVDTAGWVALGSGVTLTRTLASAAGAVAAAGDYYLQVATDGGVANQGVQLSSDIAVEPNTTYTLAVELDAVNLQNLYVQLFETAGGSADTTVGATGQVGITFQRVTVTHTTGPTATALDIRIGISGTAATIFQIDAIQLIAESSASDYFDGDTTGYQWAGTAHASTSRKNTLDLVKGDYPGRCRIVVTDAQGQDQLGLIWGIRSRYYDSGAPLVYEAEALTNMDAAADAALSGASGGTVVRHSSLLSAWTPVCFGAGPHIGTYRAWARVYTSTDPATGEVKVRLVSDVGDLTNPVENAPVTIPGASQFYLVDLGEARFDEAQVGAHAAIFVVQAKGEYGGEDFRIDELWLQPVGEFSGRLSAPIQAVTGLVSYSAHDEFNQSAGALTGKTLPVGGTWAGAGDTDDFAVEATGHTAQRTAVSDTVTSLANGRFAIAGAATFTDLIAQVQVKASAVANVTQGLFARYTDVNNFLLLSLMQPGDPGVTAVLELRKRVASVETRLYIKTDVIWQPGRFYTLALSITAAGVWSIWLDDTLMASGQDSALATAGAIASGKVGFYDWQWLSTAVTRNYDNLLLYVPTTARDAVAFASQSVELQTAGMYREDSAGTTSGPVSKVIGDLPRIPASGMEDRPVEIFAKLSRGDLDQLPDSAIDDLTLRVHYRPSYLFIPEPT